MSLFLLSGCKDVDECMELIQQKYPGIKMLNTVEGGGASYPAVSTIDIRFAYAIKHNVAPEGEPEREKCDIGVVLVDRGGGMDIKYVGALEPIFRLNPVICDYIGDVDGAVRERLIAEQIRVDAEAADNPTSAKQW